jgi:hypothetical protein
MTLSNEKYRTVSVAYVGEEYRPYAEAVYKETHEGVMVSFDGEPFALSIVLPDLDILIDWLERGGGAIHGYVWEVQ